MRARSFLGAALAAAALVSPVRDSREAAPRRFAAGATVPVQLETLATGLTSITSIAHAGDSRLFLMLQLGEILVWDGQQVLPTPFLDVSDRIVCCGEQGLLGLAFHPSYPENGFFFVDYTDTNGNTVIARYRVSSDPNRADSASAVTLLTIDQPFPNHNGGQLQFGPDGDLYIGMGDGGSANDPFCNAQSMQGAGSLLGKLLRIDVSQSVNQSPFYVVPPDNPFVSSGGPGEVWAKGLRNPWRFSFDRMTGDLFIGDVGQDRREEIDFEPRSAGGGQNYGWKIMEGTLCGEGDSAGCPPGVPACGDPSLTPPILEYGHDGGSCTVIGGYVYRGLSIPDLYGGYVYGDYCSGIIWVATRSSGAWSSGELPIQANALTTFGEDAAGELYLGTQDGTFARLSPTVPVAPTIAALSPASALARGFQSVTITGTNFTGSTQVFFGSDPAEEVLVASPTSLTAVAPPHPPGVVDVTVANPGAPAAVAQGAFSFVPIPRSNPHGTTRALAPRS